MCGREINAEKNAEKWEKRGQQNGTKLTGNKARKIRKIAINREKWAKILHLLLSTKLPLLPITHRFPVVAQTKTQHINHSNGNKTA